MKKVSLLFLFSVFFATASVLQAQSRFAVAVKGGYGTGAYEATKTGINPGKFALRVDLSYAVLPILDAYAAFSRTGFACGEEGGGFCNEGIVDFTASGFNAGLRLNRAPGMSEFIPWLRLGLTYGMLDISQTEGNNSFNHNDSGLGFEVGAGLAYPVTENIKIVPEVNYSRYTITGANGDDNPVVVIMGLIGARYEF